MGLLANRLRTNVVLNTLSPLTNAVCGFIVLPFLISRLGRETYGFWTLIVATVGYFLVLDLGISTAVGRLIAAHRAKDDIRAVNVVTVTALAFLFAVSLIVIAFSVAVPIGVIPASRKVTVCPARSETSPLGAVTVADMTTCSW